MLEFELQEQMVMVILNALGNYPYKDAAPVITELQRQINRQMTARQGNGRVETQAEAQ